MVIVVKEEEGCERILSVEVEELVSGVAETFETTEETRERSTEDGWVLAEGEIGYC